MKDKQVHILCTRALDPSIIEKAAAYQIVIDVVQFIKTVAVDQQQVKEDILTTASHHAVVVFTSMNAVEAVADCVQPVQPAWEIFCVGAQTKKLALEKFPKSNVQAQSENAAELAKLIADRKDTASVIFFCGNIRRQELPDYLRSQHIQLKEIVVYQTVFIPQKISKEYEGIVFFSPSAVDSFFSVNTAPGSAIFFAIGSTTAKAIEQYSSNKVITSEHPGKQELIELVINYFHQINQN